MLSDILWTKCLIKRENNCRISLLFSTSVQISSSVLVFFTVYRARFNMYPMKTLVAMTTEWSAEENISILFVQKLRDIVSTLCVSFTRDSLHRLTCGCLYSFVPFTPAPIRPLATCCTKCMLGSLNQTYWTDDQLRQCVYTLLTCQTGLKYGFGGSFKPCK